MIRATAIVRSALLASIACAGLSACSNTVTVHYTQPANCYLFDSDPTGSPHTTTSAGQAMFKFYKITSIQNGASDPKDFNFDPKKLFTNSTVGSNTVQSFAGGPSFSFKVTTAKATVIPKGATVNGLGRVVVAVATDTPQSEKTAQTNLLYKSSNGESVLMVRDAGPNPVFLDPCSPDNAG